MSSVDDRIVNMQFNNKQFTQGAADSQKALEGLDRTLANAGKSGGLSSMGAAVDGVSMKFSALQVAGVAALGTIVSKATSAGIDMLKSLTINPILEGFREYQTNLTSIQTVVANTGESVKTVGVYMDRLNEYSDQTIYNFSEMARNIGTFTAAGVDLKTATSAIQGIANLAALSGSNSQQASTAMYQLSQAIAAGKVGLMDWNSVVNAGMGGKVFQTALAQTAIGMGELSSRAVDLGSKTERLMINGQAFRASISAQDGSSWLTSDILVNTLKNLDGRLSVASYEAKGFKDALGEVEKQQQKLIDQGYTKKQVEEMTEVADRAYEAATVVKTMPQLFQVVKESIGSIWANSFSIIMGDFNQSKWLWSKVSEEITGPDGIISRMGKAWTTGLRSFVDAGGRGRVIRGIKNIFMGVAEVLGTVKDAFSDIFPPASANTLAEIARRFRIFSKLLRPTEDTLKSLRTIFGGFFAVLHIGFEILKGVGSLIGNVFKAIFEGSGGASSGILSIVASIAEVIIGFDKWLTAGGQISDKMGDLGTVIGAFIKPFVEGISLIVQAFATLVSGGTVSEFKDQLSALGVNASRIINAVTGAASKIQNFFSNSGSSVDGLGDRVSGLRAKIDELLNSGGGLEGIFKKIGAGAADAAASGIEIAGSIIRGLASGIASAAPEIWAAVISLGQGIIDTIKAVLGIHSPSAEMKPIGGYVIQGLIEGMKVAMQYLGVFIRGIGDFIKDLFGGMNALDIAALMNSLFTGAMILTMRDFAKGFGDIGSSVTDTLGAMQKSLKAEALLSIAGAIALMAAALIGLALVDPEKLGYGIGAIASLSAVLVATMKVLGSMDKTVKIKGKEIPVFNSNLIALAGSMLLLAGAMVVLAAAVAIFGSMDLETLAKGIGGMAFALGVLVGAMVLMSKFVKNSEGMAGSILVLAIAMNALALAVAAFGNMDLSTLAKGIGAMAWTLGLLVLAMMMLDSGVKNVEGLAGSILILALAMNAMAVAIGMLGNMDLSTLAKGIGAMGIGLALLVASMWLLAPLGPQVIVISRAMALMSAAMIGLAVAVGMFGNMSLETLAKGFLAIAVGLALLLAAAAIAQGVAPGLFALGAAVLMLGAGMALAGVGMLAFATGLAVLTTVGVGAIAIMSMAIMAFIALLPQIALQMAASFVVFIEAIAEAAPRIGQAFSKIFNSILDVVIRAIPKIGQLIQKLLDTGLKIIANSVPRWIKVGMDIIQGFLEGIAERIPKIADKALEMIQEFLRVVTANIDDIIKEGTRLVVTFLRGMGKAAQEITDACGQFLLDVLDAIDDAIVKYSDPLRDKGVAILGHIVDGLTGGLASKLQGKINDIIGGLKIDLPDIPGFGRTIAGRGMQARRQTVYDRANDAISAAYRLISANNTSSANPGTIRAAYKAQGRYDTQQAQANLAEKMAREAEKKAADAKKKADKKGATAAQKEANKRAQKAAGKARRTAERETRQAQAARDKADAAAARMQASAEFNDADLVGKGDIRNEEADRLADRANQMLEKANAEAAKARQLMKTDRKAGLALMAQAKKDAKEARELAVKARKAANEARGYYSQEAHERIEDAEKEATAKAEFEAADQAGKAAIRKKEAAESQAAADAAKAEAARLLALAKQYADSDPTRALELIEQAEEQAAIAQQAAADAERAQQEAEQLLNQPGTATAGAPGGDIGPSRSALEDAARTIDRYTASLNEATELAAATPTVVQYNQTVNSPTQLDAATVYRQSKTLIAASEINVGSAPAVL